jgi:dethiobiotin synthetase
MKKYKNIYVAATSQHVGKTTSTLGLVSAFKNMGINVGYCKPVGQRFVELDNLKVDKDVILFADLLNFTIISDIHSPVILGAKTTEIFLDNPDDFDFRNSIQKAVLELNNTYDLTVFEGTGHPGVGSVVNLSNADVSKLVDASVIMVVEGGIGSTIDMLTMTIARFEQLNIPILGVIINKTYVEKIDKIKHYLKIKLDQMGIPLLGIIPFDRSMSYPLIVTVTDAIGGYLVANPEKQWNIVQDIVAGSLVEVDDLKSENILLVVSALRLDAALSKIQMISNKHKIEHSPLSGIVATGYGDFSDTTMAYIEKHKIPLVRTNLDTYGSVVKISKIEVKINQNTPWKISRAIELIEQNVDMSKILDAIKV